MIWFAFGLAGVALFVAAAAIEGSLHAHRRIDAVEEAHERRWEP